MKQLLDEAVKRVCMERGFTLVNSGPVFDQDAVTYSLARGGEISAEISVSGLEMRSTPAGEMQNLVNDKIDGILFGPEGDELDQTEPEEEAEDEDE